MSDRLKEMRNKRGKLVTDARAILDKAETEKRELTKEEAAKYDEIFAEASRVGESIEREERQTDLERKAAQQAQQQQDESRGKDPANRSKSPLASDEYRNAYTQFLRVGRSALNAEEIRALQVDPNPSGGYLTAPEQFVNELIKGVDNLLYIRQVARKFSIPMAQSLGVPTLDADPADADWTAELGTGNEDSTMAFGKRKLIPHPLAKRIKVSNDMLTMVPGTEALVRGRLEYKFGVSLEKAYMTGNGVEKALGIFTASNDGIPTSRDYSTGNTNTTITFDGLIGAKYSLKTQYWNKGVWMFHRDALAMLAKIKENTTNAYIWRQSVRDGEPDTILGRPIITSEYVPNTFTTGLYVGAFGDFSNYWVADALDLQIKRLDELYAETNQVGFIGRLKTDGMPTLAEAFTRVTLT
jgi:HK97 family phage major capsid protein